MATKKNISDFESALLSNTKLIKNTQKEQNDLPNEIKSDVSKLISDEVLANYKKLAQREQIDLKELITLALNHFLNMEHLFFDENNTQGKA